MSVSYESNVDLGFDTTALKNSATKYGAFADELRDMAKDLDDALSELEKNGWTTPAGTAFHEMTDTNWKKNIEKYADLLECLESILDSACTQYDDLVENHIQTTKVNI